MYTKTKLRRAQNIEKFEEIYKELEKIYKDEFSQTAKRINKRMIATILTLIIGAIILLVTLVQSVETGKINSSFLFAAMAVILVLSLAISFARTPKEKSFVRDFKQRINEKLIKSIEPKLEYNPVVQNVKGILETYESMGFESSNCNSQFVDDEIIGQLNSGINIRISNVCINKSNGSRTATVFNGLFAEMKTPKHMDADIRVLLPSSSFVSNRTNKFEKFLLDDTEFENIFDVYTDNKIITSQILTSDVMAKLKDIYENYGMLFEFAIKDGKTCIRIDTGNMFESVATKNGLNKEDTFIYYSVLKFTFKLINDIYNIIENLDV